MNSNSIRVLLEMDQVELKVLLEFDWIKLNLRKNNLTKTMFAFALPKQRKCILIYALLELKNEINSKRNEDFLPYYAWGRRESIRKNFIVIMYREVLYLEMRIIVAVGFLPTILLS